MPKQNQTFISHNQLLQESEYVFSWSGVAGSTQEVSANYSGLTRNYGVNSTLDGAYTPYEIYSGGTFSWGTVSINANGSLHLVVNANTGDIRSHTIVLHQIGTDNYLTMVVTQEAVKYDTILQLDSGSYLPNTLSVHIEDITDDPHGLYLDEPLELVLIAIVSGSQEVQYSQPFEWYGPGQKDIEILFDTPPQAMGSIEVNIYSITPSTTDRYNFRPGDPLNININ